MKEKRYMSATTAGVVREQQSTSIVKLAAIGVALAVAITGLIVTGFSPMWIAGSLGISAAAATQIVAAIKAGKNAFTIIAAVAGAGVASALTATIVWLVFNWAVEPAVA
ncbi:hypothetical protein DO944_09285 [Microbacterium sp. SMR1]|nr:hypothetical protein DO944_09285 [Microbacterium sp. SMR1]